MMRRKHVAVASLAFALLTFGIDRAASADAVKFNSSSTGADGDLKLTAADCIKPDVYGIDVKIPVVIDVGKSGIKHYKSINIAKECEVKFTPTGTGSAPVRLLVQEDVVINGRINLDGMAPNGRTGGKGGPGGFNGGNSSASYNYPGNKGDGPKGGDGGQGDSSRGGFSPYGDSYKTQPLVGGGGGGGIGSDSKETLGGGGGGGAILIASSGVIQLDGSITAAGTPDGGWTWTGRGADGGMVHLIATEIIGKGSLRTKIMNDDGSLRTTLSPGRIFFETLNTYNGSIDGSNISATHLETLTYVPPVSSTLSIDKIADKTITNGQPVSFDAPGVFPVVITSSGLGENTEVVVVSSSRSKETSSKKVKLDSSGRGISSATIVGGANKILAYVNVYMLKTAALQYQGEQIVTARLEAGLGQNSHFSFYTGSGVPVPSKVAQDLSLERYVDFGMVDGDKKQSSVSLQ